AVEAAFNELPATLRQQVTTQYADATGGQISQLALKDNRGTATPQRVEKAVELLQSANPQLRFSMDRYQPITAEQAAVFKEVLDRYAQHLVEINAGRHDH